MVPREQKEAFPMNSEREAARAAGLKHYSGKPCSKPGHGRVRYVSTDGCLDCVAGYNAAAKRAKDAAAEDAPPSPEPVEAEPAEVFEVEEQEGEAISANWTMTPPEVAAEAWEPPVSHSTRPPDRYVERIRALLATGAYRHVVAADGQAFVGTPEEVETHMRSREAHLSARIVPPSERPNPPSAA
jgi:hypothetical protein